MCQHDGTSQVVNSTRYSNDAMAAPIGHLSENFTGDRSISYVNRSNYIVFNKLRNSTHVNFLYIFSLAFIDKIISIKYL